MVLVPAVQLEDGDVPLKLFQAKRTFLDGSGFLLAVLLGFVLVFNKETLFDQFPYLQFEFDLRERVNSAGHERNNSPKCQPSHESTFEENVGDKDDGDKQE